jgi:hypothetical protein
MKLMFLIFLILPIFLFSSCQLDQQTKIEKKELSLSLTRDERVKKIPYRGQYIHKSEEDSIRKDVSGILNQFKREIVDNKDVKLGLKKTNNFQFKRINKEFATISELKDYLNRVWLDENLNATIAVFSSYSIDALSGEKREFIVFELEYEKFTGTWRAFLDLPIQDKDLYMQINLLYHDRN